MHPHLVIAFDHDRPAQSLVSPPDAEPAKHLIAAVGLLRVGQGVERLIADLDRGSGPPGSLRVHCRHHRHRLSPEPGLVAGQNRLVGVLQPEGGPSRDVAGGETGVDTTNGERRGQVNRDDAGAGVRAAHGVRPEHPLGTQVLGIVELAAELRHAVGAQR